MADVLVQDSSLQSIADAIRAKTGGTDTYKPSDMAAAIEGIETGGGSGIGAVKFIDVDITVDASTETAVTYTVDGLEFLTSNEAPTKWDSFSLPDMYFVTITPKEYTGEASGNYSRIYKDSAGLMYGWTNYTVASMFNNYGGGKYTDAYGIYAPKLSCDSVDNGVPKGRLIVSVRHINNTYGYEVIEGIYNIKVWLLTDIKWRQWE